MSDSPGGEFRNPYAPLPPQVPTGIPSAARADGGLRAPAAPTDAAGPTSRPRRRASRRTSAATVAPGAGDVLGRSRSVPGTVPGSGIGPVPGALPDAAGSGSIPPDPWRELASLSGGPAVPRRQPLRVGVFTLREVLIALLGLAQLGAGFISVSPGVYHPVIALGVLWVMIVALPGIAVALVVVRRLWAPQLRVGMFGVDAFAAASSVSALLGWLNVMGLGPVAWFGCLLAVGFVVVALAGSLIPGLREDFTSRAAALAHPSERPLHPPAGQREIAGAEALLVSAADVARSTDRPVRAATMFPMAGPFRHPVPRVGDAETSSSAPTETGSSSGHGLAREFGSGSADDAARRESTHGAASMGAVGTTAGAPSVIPAPAVGAEPEPSADDNRAGSDSETPAHRGFWILVPQERMAVDPLGRPMFPVVPSAWTLALEDRGDRLLVRAADGRVGILTDLTGVIRN